MQVWRTSRAGRNSARHLARARGEIESQFVNYHRPLIEVFEPARAKEAVSLMNDVELTGG